MLTVRTHQQTYYNVILAVGPLVPNLTQEETNNYVLNSHHTFTTLPSHRPHSTLIHSLPTPYHIL